MNLIDFLKEHSLKFRASLRQRFGSEPPPALASILQRMVARNEDPLVLLRDLVAAVRPASCRGDGLLCNWHELLALLEEHVPYRQALAEIAFSAFAQRDQRSFYTEAGLLPNSGFFSEIRQELARKLLPEKIEQDSFQDSLHALFHRKGDLAWLESIPPEERTRLWRLLAAPDICLPAAQETIREQLLESIVVAAHRIAAMGLEPELLRPLPRLARGASPFIALCDELSQVVHQLRNSNNAPCSEAVDTRHLLVLLGQCREVVERVHHAAATRGTSLTLTFLIVRLRQHLDRFETLLTLLSPGAGADEAITAASCWNDFLWGTIEAELRRHIPRKHLAGLTSLISLRITENAGRTGEHYIAVNRAEWRGMWRAGAGAGFLIAGMALLKILGESLHLAVLNQGLLNGLIYGGGFVVIHMCRGTVATKQPAMTAATIAATVSQTRGRMHELGRLAELVVATIRSQLAAIAGNVLIAFPLAVALLFAIDLHRDDHLIAANKAATLLKDIDPLSGALVYAAIAGVWLFVAGLVSGYVDNQAAYSRLGERVACHPGLVRILGMDQAARLGDYLDHNAGSLAGNLFFGMMLGLTPAFGAATSLPFDIRHIAFSAANFGYALVSLQFQVTALDVLRGALGVLLIGGVNLAISFSLAMAVALRSRGISFTATGALLPELGRRLRHTPARFFVPKAEVEPLPQEEGNNNAGQG